MAANVSIRQHTSAAYVSIRSVRTLDIKECVSTHTNTVSKHTNICSSSSRPSPVAAGIHLSLAAAGIHLSFTCSSSRHSSCALRTRSVFLFLFLIFFYIFCHTCRGRRDSRSAPRTRSAFVIFMYLLCCVFNHTCLGKEGFSARATHETGAFLYFYFLFFLQHLSREEGFTTRTADEISVDANAADFIGRRRIHEPKNERFRRRVVHRRH